MKRTFILLLFIFTTGLLAAQTKSPAEFSGCELGERFTPHHKVVAYYGRVAANTPNVKLHYYGTTNALRPLLVAFVSSQQNIDNLETIRQDNLRRTGMISGTPSTKIPITWMSYNVHGNEAVSSEATMMTLWALVDPSNKDTKSWLAN